MQMNFNDNKKVHLLNNLKAPRHFAWCKSELKSVIFFINLIADTISKIRTFKGSASNSG